MMIFVDQITAINLIRIFADNRSAQITGILTLCFLTRTINYSDSADTRSPAVNTPTSYIQGRI